MKIIYALLFVSLSFNIFLLRGRSPEVAEDIPSPITLQELEQNLKNHCPFENSEIGTVCAFAGKIPDSRLKDGWIEASGQELNHSTYPKLCEMFKKIHFNRKGDECLNIDLRSGFIRQNKKKVSTHPSLVVYGIKAN